jgi:hypothetical protein
MREQTLSPGFSSRVGRSRKGILFQASSPLVHLIFLIGTPPNAIAEYLGCVAWLAGRVALQSRHDLFAQHGQDARIHWAGSRSRSAERSDDLKRNAASAVQSAMYRTAMPEIIRGLAREIESFVHRHRKPACTFYATETRIAIGAAREGIGAPIMMMHHSAAVSESSYIHTEGSSQSGECPFGKLRDRDLSHLFGGRHL